MELWPHQTRMLDSLRYSWNKTKRLCLVAPPGAGKSFVMRRIAVPCAKSGLKVVIYSHRIMLTKQLQEGFLDEGIKVGVIANGFEADPSCNIQIASIQTLASRMDNTNFDFPYPDVAIVDEAHQQVADMSKRIFDKCRKNKEFHKIGFTATPVGLLGHYDKIINEVTYSELIDCNSHLPVHIVEPQYIDMSDLKPQANGEFSENQVRKKIKAPVIFGNVYTSWKKENPNALPAILFAPGVGESKFFCEMFREKGVPNCHIDGDRTILVAKNPNGILVSKEYQTTDKTREEVKIGAEEGKYKIINNRFLLREAIDIPCLYHCILATVMGGLSTFLQSTGRVLRYYKDYDPDPGHVLIQDHAGNVYRHMWPNQEREWKLDCTNRSMQQEIRQQIKSKKEGEEDGEPITCPKCQTMRQFGPQCPSCGHIHKRSVRFVQQLNGEMIRKTGRTEKYVKPLNQKPFEHFFSQALFAGYAKAWSVGRATEWAKRKQEMAGSDSPISSNKPMYTSEDREWMMPVREVYPRMKPKHFGKKRK